MAKTYQLAFNNEPLDLTDLKHPAVNYYMKAMEQLGDFKKNQNPKLSYPIEFEFRNEFYELGNPYTEDQPETHCQKLSLPTSCMVNVKVDEQIVSGRFTIYENMIRDENNKNVFTPKSMDIDPRMSFEDDVNSNIQLFFLMFASTYTEPLKGEDGKPMLKYHNGTPNKKKFLIVRNVRKENVDTLNIRRKAALVNKYLLDETDGLEEAKIMQIAAVYGIKNADNPRYIEDIRLELDRRVNKENLNDMLAFLKLVDSESDTEVLATIAKAKELDLIKTTSGANKIEYWKIADADKDFTICACKKNEDADMTLQKELIGDYTKYQRVKKIVNEKLKEQE